MNKFRRFLEIAGKFYLQALQSFEKQPEIAYLNLITCGEVLSNYYKYDKDELLDSETKEILLTIKTGLDNGEKISNQIKSKLRQIKKIYIKTITNLLNNYFFENSECQDKCAKLKKENIEKNIAAAYDLRSKFLHTGAEFGNWISQNIFQNQELLIGVPNIKDNKLKKYITDAPTYIGLERIMRFCLLRFMQLEGKMEIDDRLNDQ